MRASENADLKARHYRLAKGTSHRPADFEEPQDARESDNTQDAEVPPKKHKTPTRRDGKRHVMGAREPVNIE